jgi:hypothetical protein
MADEKTEKKKPGRKKWLVAALLILAAVFAIQTARSSVSKARAATDAANERSAKALAQITFLRGDGGAVAGNYDAENGKLVALDTAPTGYGRCELHRGDYLTVSVDESGEATVSWSQGGANHNES